MSRHHSFYEKIRQKGVTIRRHPDGRDPSKIELFGEFKSCSKCKKTKHIYDFDFKGRRRPDGSKRPGIAAECGHCRKLQKIRKYNSDPHSYVFRLIQLAKQPSAIKKGRRPCTMKIDEFLNEWQKQFEITGLTCPKLGIKMTFTGGENRVRTNISLDRIDGKKNYELGNVQFVSHIYNIMKQHYTDKEVDEFCLLRVDVIKKLENGHEMFVKGQW
tara:strand:+ start:34 stop:678 length:645 start_codon:yes stop_codon:yes gene_type:complete